MTESKRHHHSLSCVKLDTAPRRGLHCGEPITIAMTLREQVLGLIEKYGVVQVKEALKSFKPVDLDCDHFGRFVNFATGREKCTACGRIVVRGRK